MSEEDAFLDGLAADRADRTRLLVFADWLADRDDPREEFVRLHTRLLDLDGSEAEFDQLEWEWWAWTFGEFSLAPTRVEQRLPERWVDALCRVFSYSDVKTYYTTQPSDSSQDVEQLCFRPGDHLESHQTGTLTLYHARSDRWHSPFRFVAATILPNLRWSNPFRQLHPSDVQTQYRYLLPITRGTFWQLWQSRCTALRTPPSLPVIASDNRFLCAQRIEGDPDNSGCVAIYQYDYFALFWDTTD